MWLPNPRPPPRRFTESELLKLAGLFNTHEIYNSRTEGPLEVLSERAPIISGQSGLNQVFESLTNYLRDLEDQISSLTTRVWELEQRHEIEERSEPQPVAEPKHLPVQESPAPNGNGQRLPEEQAVVVAETAHAFALAGRRAAFPAGLKDIAGRLGYPPEAREFNGLGSARAYFEQARNQGVIRFGPEDENGSPTILPLEV